MYILANEKRLTITREPGVQRNKITGQLILTLTTGRENATASEIEELITYIAENGPTIVVYDDEDNQIVSLAGFKLYPSFALTKVGTWEIVIENESENTFQLERANEKIKALEITVADQEQTILGQIEIINAQGETIGYQAEEITLLNDTLLEILMG